MVSFSAYSLVQGSEAKKVQSRLTCQLQAWILGATTCKDKRKHKAESGTKPLREQDKFKTCTFQDNEDSGEVCGTESASSLPGNVPQVNITKHQLGLTTSAASKVNSDPLMAVLDLQKGSCSWSVSEVTCNDLPTVMLFTNQQMDDIIGFCRHKKRNFVSQLGLDATFQLGPFYLPLTTCKNHLLTVQGNRYLLSRLGPVMVCITKEQLTYLSFLHCL